MVKRTSLFFVCFLISIAAFDVTPQTLTREPADLKAALKQINEATPASLPQTPVIPSPTSDAQELRLKGKVKAVFEETTTISSPWKDPWRALIKYREFDAAGGHVRDASFDWRGGGLHGVTVYGYLNGKRVSFTGPPPTGTSFPRFTVGTVNTEPLEQPSRTKDAGYEFAYEYKYEEGRLVERQLFTNDGRKQNRIVLTHAKDQAESRKYLPNGELNERYIFIYDAKGNEIERRAYHGGPGGVSEKFSTYEFVYDRFDSEGNWTERSVYSVTTESGKKKAELIRTEYRTIEYFK